MRRRRPPPRRPAPRGDRLHLVRRQLHVDRARPSPRAACAPRAELPGWSVGRPARGRGRIRRGSDRRIMVERRGLDHDRGDGGSGRDLAIPPLRRPAPPRGTLRAACRRRPCRRPRHRRDREPRPRTRQARATRRCSHSQAALCGIAVYLTYGARRRPWERPAVTDLVVDLGETRTGTVRDALAQALGRPDARGRLSARRRVRRRGRSAEEPAGRYDAAGDANRTRRRRGRSARSRSRRSSTIQGSWTRSRPQRGSPLRTRSRSRTCRRR